MMAQIFLYKHEAGINPQQLQKLRREGFIPIGVRYIDDVKLLDEPLPLSQATSDIILLAACRAIKQNYANGGTAAGLFGAALAEGLVAADEAAKADL